MLGKLIRHEFQATARYFVPMYLGLAIITLLLKISLVFDLGGFQTYSRGFFLVMINTLLIIIYVIAVIAAFLLTLVITLRRFYSNLFGDEGYLMFTLPVTTGQILNSKLIVALIWEIITFPVILLSFFILFFSTDVIRFLPYLGQEITEGLRVLSLSGYRVGLLIAEMIVGLILQNILTILMFYLAITLGQKMMPTHRFLGTVVAFLGVYLVTEMVSSAFMSLVGTFSINDSSSYYAVNEVMSYLGTLFPIAIVLNLIIGAVYYLLTHYLLEKKLNLS